MYLFQHLDLRMRTQPLQILPSLFLTVRRIMETRISYVLPQSGPMSLSSFSAILLLTLELFGRKQANHSFLLS